jgi:hypothetical protein
MEEVLASQAAMLALQPVPQAMDRALLRTAFQRQVAETRSHLDRIPSFRVRELDHRSLLGHPANAAAEIAKFLSLPMDMKAMAACVDPSLYRQRTHGAAPAPD